jgi:hypothetical protein
MVSRFQEETQNQAKTHDKYISNKENATFKETVQAAK